MLLRKLGDPGTIVGFGPELCSYTICCSMTGRFLRRNRVLLQPRQVTFQQEAKRDNCNNYSDPENYEFLSPDESVSKDKIKDSVNLCSSPSIVDGDDHEDISLEKENKTSVECSPKATNAATRSDRIVRPVKRLIEGI